MLWESLLIKTHQEWDFNYWVTGWSHVGMINKVFLQDSEQWQRNLGIVMKSMKIQSWKSVKLSYTYCKYIGIWGHLLAEQGCDSQRETNREIILIDTKSNMTETSDINIKPFEIKINMISFSSRLTLSTSMALIKSIAIFHRGIRGFYYVNRQNKIFVESIFQVFFLHLMSVLLCVLLSICISICGLLQKLTSHLVSEQFLFVQKLHREKLK